MSRLVLKSSVDGRAAVRSISGLGSGCFFVFFHRLVALFLRPGDTGGGVDSWLRASVLTAMPSSAFFLLRKRFMVTNLNMLVGQLVFSSEERRFAGYVPSGACPALVWTYRVACLSDVEKKRAQIASARSTRVTRCLSLRTSNSFVCRTQSVLRKYCTQLGPICTLPSTVFPSLLLTTAALRVPKHLSCTKLPNQAFLPDAR